MPDKNKIVIVTNDFGGKESLYLNGVIVVQNNPIPRFEVTETMVSNQPFSFEELEVFGEWLDMHEGFPERLSNIPEEAFTN